MKKNYLIICIPLMLGVLACATLKELPAKFAGTPTPPVTETASPTSSPTITPTPFYAVSSGRRISLIASGIEAATINGFYRENDDFQLKMASKDYATRVDIFSFPVSPGVSLEESIGYIAADIAESIQAETIPDPETMRIKGMDALKIELDGVDVGYSPNTRIDSGLQLTSFTLPSRKLGSILHLQVTLFGPKDSKRVAVVVSSVGEKRWEREGQKANDVLLKNLSFFPIVSRSDCPVSRNPEYGFSEDNPVQVGGGFDEYHDRARIYFESLLGFHEEVVSYKAVEYVIRDDDAPDAYMINYGTIHKMIFIDEYKKDELFVPFEMKCSTLAPFQ